MKVKALCYATLAMGTLASLAAAQAPHTTQALQLHVRPAVSNGQAKLVAPLSPATQMHLAIVLKPRNADQLAQLLSRLYDPSSPDFHRFLSVSDFTNQFAPTADDYQAVVEFAQRNGFRVTGSAPNRMLVPVIATVAQIQTAFGVHMQLYQHPTENRTFFSPDREPALALDVPIAHIEGLNNYSLPHPLWLKGATRHPTPAASNVQGSGPAGSYLGSDMRAAYYGGAALTGSGQTVGLAQFDGYNLSDVNLTFSTAGQTNSVPIHNVLLDGATGAPGQFLAPADDAEQVLDIVQAASMAPGLDQIRVYIGNNDADILNAMATENLARQLSISWTWSPDDPTVDDIFFEEFAAQGQTVFAASGDYGAYSGMYPYYYPAEDAWVTAVGGTTLTTHGAGGPWAAETAWDRSGGGASPDGIDIPAWQTGVANPSNGGSDTVRNVPDVAMEADFDNFACDLGQCAETYAGTSFAAPRWAAFMALANQQAAAVGNAPAGFLNPTLYSLGSSTPSALHDIVSGNNDYAGNPEQASFDAAPGYDLVTGWGSPSGQSLINVLAPHTQAGFLLSTSAQQVSVAPGGSGTLNVSITPIGGFASAVTLAVTGLPNGVTGTFSTDPATTGSVLTFNADDTAVRGTYALTVTGTSGALQATANFALQVNAPGFTLAPASAMTILRQGAADSVGIQVTNYAGFSAPVTLTVTSPLPDGVTALVNAAASAITFLVSSTADLGSTGSINAPITVTGTSGALTNSTTFEIEVLPPGAFLGITSIPFVLAQGSSNLLEATIVPWGSLDPEKQFTLSTAEVPTGVSLDFSPATLSAFDWSQVTLHTAASAAPGDSVIAILASTTSDAEWAGFVATIVPAPQPAFSIGVDSLYVPLMQGATATDGINVLDLNGYSGPVAFDTSQLPAGVTASFDNPSAQTRSTLTLTASAAAPPGLYTMKVSGSTPDATFSALSPLYLLVEPALDFTLGVTPSALTLAPGSAGSVALNLASQNSSGAIAFSTSPLPEGFNTTIHLAPGSATGTIDIEVSKTVAAGSYSFNLTATDGSQTQTVTIYVMVAIPTSTTLTIEPATDLTANAAYSLTAVVSPGVGSDTPTGNVLFHLGFAPAAISVPLDAMGTATYSGVIQANPGSYGAYAVYQGAAGYLTSTSNALTITIDASQADPPAFSLPAGTYAGAQTITLSDTAPASTIYYTTDGSTPTTASALYTGPISVATSETIQAIAHAPAYAQSAVSSATYTIAAPPAVPTLSTMTPLIAPAGASGFTLTVSGSGFGSNAVVYWNATPLSTKVVTATQLAAQVPASAVAPAGVASITVHAGGTVSNAVQFEVDSAPPSTPAPQFSSTTATVAAGATATYPVTLSTAASGVPISCLNLPPGAQCAYSPSAGAVRIATAPATPAGTYAIIVVFTENIPTSSSGLLIPFAIMMISLRNRRRRVANIGIASILIALLSACGGGIHSPSSVSGTQPVTISAAVQLIVQ